MRLHPPHIVAIGPFAACGELAPAPCGHLLALEGSERIQHGTARVRDVPDRIQRGPARVPGRSEADPTRILACPGRTGAGPARILAGQDAYPSRYPSGGLGWSEAPPGAAGAAPSGYLSTALLEATPWVLRSESILTVAEGADAERVTPVLGEQASGRAMFRP